MGLTYTLPDNTQVYLEVDSIQNGKVKLKKKNILIETQSLNQVIEKFKEDAKTDFTIVEDLKKEIENTQIDVIVVTAKVAKIDYDQ